MNKGVIILSDNPDVHQFCASSLVNKALFKYADSWDTCLRILDHMNPDVLVIDFSLLHAEGAFLLPPLIRSKPFVKIVILMQSESTFLTVRLLKMGIYDVIPYPCARNHFFEVIQKVLLEEDVIAVPSGMENSQSSFSLLESCSLFRKVAKTDYSVLLLGDSGTGKTYHARQIVELSRRKNESFIWLNCSEIPDSIAESELFGTEKGAFTGADKNMGKFESAHRGTLFLDEVADLSLNVQAKLLKVIETGSFYRLGSSKETKVDVRLIFAANCDLKQRVAEKKFRFDLYQRISVVKFYLPPLKTQIDKLPYFASLFLTGSGKSISEDALQKLMNHSWEGNLRELQNCLVRATILSDSDTIYSKHIIFDSIILNGL